MTNEFPLPSGEGPICFLDFSIGGTSVGRVKVKLYQDKVPLAVENFRALCTGEKGMGRSGKPLHYQFSKVHRIVSDFCVQLGDFTKGDGTGGESIYSPNSEHGDMWGKFKDEMFMQHSKAMLLSMANNGPNRNSSQFFFTLKPVSYLDGKHVVFGEGKCMHFRPCLEYTTNPISPHHPFAIVIEGMDVVKKIGSLKTNAKQRPDETVVVESCGELVDGKEIKKESSAGMVETSKSPFGFSGLPAASSTGGNPSSVGIFGSTSTFSNAFGSQSSSTAGAATPSPFSFGTNTSTSSETATSHSSKSLFGGAAASASKPFSFGGGGTPTFSFGSTTSTLGSNPTDGGSKPLFGDSSAKPSIFGSSTSGTTPSFTFGPAGNGK